MSIVLTPRLKRSAILLMVASAACWGLGTVMSKRGVDSAPSVDSATRAINGERLVLVDGGTDTRASPNLEVLTSYFAQAWVSGVLEPALSYTFGLMGLAMSSASHGTLIAATEPLLILGFAWLLLREQIRFSLFVLSTVAIVGVTLVVSNEVESPATNRALLGDAWMIVGTCCAALYAISSRRAVGQLNSLTLSALQQTVGLAGVVLIWLTVEPFTLSQWTTIRPTIWLVAGLSGIVQYALAFWLYLKAIKHIPVSIAAQFLSLIPVFGVGGAYFFLNERFTLVQGTGMLLVLGAVLMISQSQPRPSH